MKKFTERQLKILEFIEKTNSVGNKEIGDYLGRELSRYSVLRDINELLANNLIKKSGKGRNVRYENREQEYLLKYFSPDDYFAVPPDKRDACRKFNFNIFNDLQKVFNADELSQLNTINAVYQERIKKYPRTALKREFERLTIELSWKSSAIEGNTYTLIDTEFLIKENREARGKKKEEAIMIMNHKKALDYVIAQKSIFQKLSASKIENIHSLIVDGLGVSKGVRKRIVGITGTVFKPLDNEYQIREALEKMSETVNVLDNPFSKALSAILLTSYIQPFEDDNKRTARILGNAILLAFGACPISYRSIDEAEYKKATLLFYEKNSARYFKELFIDQFKFAVDNYFGA